MDNNTAIKVLTSLAHGINPTTGEFLPNESVLNGLDTTRALFFAAECMRDGMQRLILWDTKPSDEPQRNLSAHPTVHKSNQRKLDGVWQYHPVYGKTEETKEGLVDKMVYPDLEETKSDIPDPVSLNIPQNIAGQIQLCAQYVDGQID